ncbi:MULTISPECIES: hypothetical protein [unclassified Microcoleus]|uniref:hypothetical protein n=1 Tax=unclassified Microcoleus TaxID=2642155 RepID=UPI0025ECF724|nr:MULTISPECIES: hypothetical protein [unclassified Microcoleus]
MSDFSTNKVILVSTATTDATKPPETEGFMPLLMYGGVAVAVIFAMAYFSQTLLSSITQLTKTLNKKHK